MLISGCADDDRGGGNRGEVDSRATNGCVTIEDIDFPRLSGAIETGRRHADHGVINAIAIHIPGGHRIAHLPHYLSPLEAGDIEGSCMGKEVLRMTRQTGIAIGDIDCPRRGRSLNGGGILATGQQITQAIAIEVSESHGCATSSQQIKRGFAIDTHYFRCLSTRGHIQVDHGWQLSGETRRIKNERDN